MLPALAEPRVRRFVAQLLLRCGYTSPQREPFHPPPLARGLTVGAAADAILSPTVLRHRLRFVDLRTIICGLLDFLGRGCPWVCGRGRVGQVHRTIGIEPWLIHQQLLKGPRPLVPPGEELAEVEQVVNRC